MKNFDLKKSVLPTLIAFFTLITIFLPFPIFKNINNTFDNKFSDYMQNKAETVAAQLSELAVDFEQTPILFDKIAKSVIKFDKNIIDIEFSDIAGNTISVKQIETTVPNTADSIKITVPVTVEKSGETKTIGSVKLNFTDKAMKKEINKQKYLIISLFLFVLMCFATVILMQKAAFKKEMSIFYTGLKKISDGQFGTKINTENNNQIKPLVNVFNDLSIKLKKYEEQNVGSILLERNKLEAILMSIIDGVVVCNNNDNIVLINSSAERMLNVTAENVTGVQIQCYSDFNGEYSFRDKIEEFKDTPLDKILKTPFEYTTTIDKKIFRCTISPIFMQNGDYVGYIIVIHDITKETEVNNLKNQFISNVSHELRTPVTVLRTYIDTLYTMEDELDEETRKEFTATANKEVTRLHRMVNDILDVSRLESPDVELEKEITEIAPIIEDTVSSMQILADEKNVKINFEKPAEEISLPINVANIERVFNNLISNAIKYSPENEKIKIILKQDGNFADISVTDHGCGIEEKHLKKLFERFYRVENSVHTVKGTGLGLYLVKTTVEKHHGGKVYVKSKVGEGSTFGIRLPLS